LTLFELGRNAGEFGVQFRPKAVHDSNDGDRNPGSDQALFNRGRPGFVFEKRLKSVPHEYSLPSAERDSEEAPRRSCRGLPVAVRGSDIIQDVSTVRGGD